MNKCKGDWLCVYCSNHLILSSNLFARFFSLGLIVAFKLNPEETLPAHRLLKSGNGPKRDCDGKKLAPVLFEKNSHKRLLTAKSIAKILATLTQSNCSI